MPSASLGDTKRRANASLGCLLLFTGMGGAGLTLTALENIDTARGAVPVVSYECTIVNVPAFSSLGTVFVFIPFFVTTS